MRMRGVLVMCAPRFSAGSEGDKIMTQVMDSFIRLRALAEAIAKNNRDEDNGLTESNNDKQHGG